MTSIRNLDLLAATPARALALRAVEAVLEAVTPERLVPQALRLDGDVLHAAGAAVPLRGRRLWLLAAGKAAGGMAAAAEEVIGRERVRGGVVVTVPSGQGTAPEVLEGLEGVAGNGALDHPTIPRTIPVRFGDHPYPSERSLAATREMLDIAEQTGPGDLVLFLISGGASALLAAPAPGLTLEDEQAATRALVRSGAAIDEMNAVRKHLSAVKGGLLARALAPAQVVTLALSDVVSGRLDVIGSGPTVPDPSTYRDALDVLAAYGLEAEVPPAVLEHLRRGAAGGLPETPKAGDPCFEGAVAAIIGGPSTAAAAAVAEARRTPGVHGEVLTDQLAGEARGVAAFLGGIVRYWAGAFPDRPQVIVAAGEPTVTVTGGGRGGRCQELAAALIPELDGLPDCAVVCAATDGRDFVDGAGGALVDGETALQARTLGLRPQQFLRTNDTYELHRRLGTLLETGPTGTNVCDLVVCALNVRGSDSC